MSLGIKVESDRGGHLTASSDLCLLAWVHTCLSVYMQPHKRTHRIEMLKPEALHIPTAGKIIKEPGATLNWSWDLGWIQVIG